MKNRMVVFVVGFLSFMLVGNVFATGLKIADWRQKLVDASVSDLQKTCYVDSILRSLPVDSLDLKIMLADLLTKMGRYDRASEVRKALLSCDDSLLSNRKKLAINAELARDLINREDLVGAINICNEILQQSVIDIGFQEEMKVYGVMHYISIRTSRNDSQRYLDLGNSLLEKARKANYPQREIEEMQNVLIRMRMSDQLSKNKFNEFFSLADSVMAHPMSNSYRLQLDLLWAYAKMINGEDDLAMEKYRDIVDKPLWHVRQGEALLNLTDLLIKNKKYEATLELLHSKKDIVSLIPKGSYISMALKVNEAVSMNAVGNTKGAFPIVLNSFEALSDLYYKTLMYNATETIENITKSSVASSHYRHNDERNELAIWIFAVGGIITLAGCVWLVLKLRYRQRQLQEAYKRISEIESRHKNEMESHIEKIKDQEKTVTTNALQLARINETIELIRELVKDKVPTDSDKIKSVSTALSALAPQTELWEIFKINFDQVHSGFFSRLYVKHPDLTPIEARMCAYLAMNLSSKEIAALTNRSLRSVESIRYRLNKKIELPKDVTLANYLRYFAVIQNDNTEDESENFLG